MGFALFSLLTALVQVRWTEGIDRAVAQWVADFSWEPLGWWSGLAAVLVSAEASVLYGGLAALLLWRVGLGWWSLAPLAFLLAFPVEFGMKLTVDQPLVLPEWVRPGYHYPLISVVPRGSFPSGHALRSGYLCVFAGVMLWQLGGPRLRGAALGMVPLLMLLGITRIYMGYHWTSDVVAGLALGMAIAFLVAPVLAERIAAKSGR